MAADGASSAAEDALSLHYMPKSQVSRLISASITIQDCPHLLGSTTLYVGGSVEFRKIELTWQRPVMHMFRVPGSHGVPSLTMSFNITEKYMLDGLQFS